MMIGVATDLLLCARYRKNSLFYTFMSKENLPESKKSKEITKKLRPEDVIFAQPTKPMTAEEVLREMKKQGLRPATLEEVGSFMSPTLGIDPSKVIEGEVVPDEPEKPLLEHKKEEK